MVIMHLRNISEYIFVALLTSGCTGEIVTENLSSDDIFQKGHKFNGVIYYPQALFFEESKTTIRKDENDKVIAWEVEKDPKKQCIAVPQRRLVTRPDYKHPQLITYNHGILEDYKFNVTLNPDGTLQTVGSETATDRGQTFGNLTSAAVSGAKIAGVAAAVAQSKPPCNDGAIVTKITPYKE